MATFTQKARIDPTFSRAKAGKECLAGEPPCVLSRQGKSTLVLVKLRSSPQAELVAALVHSLHWFSFV